MSRVIKFRVWFTKTSTWVTNAWMMTMTGEIQLYGYDSWEKAYTICEQLPDAGFVVEQFTGLTDQNDKEIYEGDIVECATHRYQIMFYQPSGAWIRIPTRWLFDTHTFFTAIYDREDHALDRHKATHHQIIGNIHEHPELLKQ